LWEVISGRGVANFRKVVDGEVLLKGLKQAGDFHVG
jgi:hypothetical protein